jgi:hypothetical protein
LVRGEAVEEFAELGEGKSAAHLLVFVDGLPYKAIAFLSGFVFHLLAQSVAPVLEDELIVGHGRQGRVEFGHRQIEQTI